MQTLYSPRIPPRTVRKINRSMKQIEHAFTELGSSAFAHVFQRMGAHLKALRQLQRILDARDKQAVMQMREWSRRKGRRK